MITFTSIKEIKQIVIGVVSAYSAAAIITLAIYLVQ